MDNGLQFSEQTLTHNLIAQRNPITHTTVYYIAIYKESESGLLYNPRLLVLEDKNFNIFYTKHFRPVQQLSEMQRKGAHPIKEQLSIINSNAQVEENMVTIHFIRDGIKKKWVFRFHNEKLALNWLVLYKDIQEKYIAKTIKSKTGDTATNSGQSQSASILSHNRYYHTFNPNNSLLISQAQPQVYSSVRIGNKASKMQRQEHSEKEGKGRSNKSQKI